MKTYKEFVGESTAKKKAIKEVETLVWKIKDTEKSIDRYESLVKKFSKIKNPSYTEKSTSKKHSSHLSKLKKRLKELEFKKENLLKKHNLETY
jgi:hypothetical protein